MLCPTPRPPPVLPPPHVLDVHTPLQRSYYHAPKRWRLYSLLLSILAGFERRMLHINFALFALVKFVILIVVAAHWGACLWALVGILDDGKDHSWIFNLGFMDSSADELYAASLHWSLMTLISIGYGDISPTTFAEFAVSAAVQVVAGCAWAYIIGNGKGCSGLGVTNKKSW